MGSEFLSDYIENAEEYARALIPRLEGKELDRKGIHSLCFAFRQHGACSLLLKNSAKDMHLRAMQSPGAFLYFLQYAGDDQQVISQANPFFDAMGCGHWDAAAAIAKSSRETWNADHEYEEDFLFVRFLMEHFFLGSSEKRCRELIDHHAEVTEGEDGAHRDVCTAFLMKDESLFHRGLTELLEERKEKVEGMVARDAMPEEHWSWLRYFSLQGWALLKLAEKKGMETKANYLHVPKALRKASPLKFDPNAWRSFDYQP